MKQVPKKVVVIGGGFAGINIVKHLRNNDSFNITLVDKLNYNFFPPLLYQVATGFLEPSSISFPYRRFLRKMNNVRFRMGTLLKIIPEKNTIVLSNGELEYDYLIIATGAESNFFGIKNLETNAIPMKTMSDALYLRNTLLKRFEEASRTADADQLNKLLTIVVAGAGPTGVELSGMFAELYKNIILKDYPELVKKNVGGIYLVDAAKVVLGTMSAKAQKYSYKMLKKMGVTLKLGVGVRDYKDDVVTLSDNTTIPTSTLIWAAGVTAKTIEGIPAEAYGKGKRIMVDAYNKMNAAENVFVLGDTCLQSSDPTFPNGHPQLAQVAIQQAKNLAKNMVRNPSYTSLWTPFIYNDKGSMAIIGRYKAISDLQKPKISFDGAVAWLLWLFVHIVSLLSFHNKLKTLYNWMGAYFTKDQHYRMILSPEDKPNTRK